jgi:segregation and condensation protein A
LADQDFRVDLDVYRGPLDLLLYLVRKHEVELTEIPLSKIADQYLAHLETLQLLEIDDVGDFLEIASLLLEIKSRQALPRQTEEVEEQVDEAKQDLVQRLLEYKRFKDAAVILEERSREWSRRVGRQSNDFPDRELDLAEQPIGDVELWDLVSAFGRIIREQQELDPTSIVYDDTPIDVYMKQVHQRLVRTGSMAFGEVFEAGMHKSAMIGVFLAVLELSRRYNVLLEQSEPHGEIVLRPGAGFDPVFKKFGEGIDEEELSSVTNAAADGSPPPTYVESEGEDESTATVDEVEDSGENQESSADPWGLGDSDQEADDDAV